MCYTLSVWPKTARSASLSLVRLASLTKTEPDVPLGDWNESMALKTKDSQERSKPLKGAHSCGRKLSEYPNPLSKCPHIQSFSELLEEICIFSWGFHVPSSDEKLLLSESLSCCSSARCCPPQRQIDKHSECLWMLHLQQSCIDWHDLLTSTPD